MMKQAGVLPPDEKLLPVERLVYESSLVRIGAFCCAADDPLFPDSGPIQMHALVFPRSTVGIEHEGAAPFVASPGFVNLYHTGQRYRRFPIGASADDCDWYHFAPSLLWEMTPYGIEAGLFDIAQIPVTERIQLLHRQLFNYVSLVDHPDSLLVTEAACEIASSVFQQSAASRIQGPVRPGDSRLVNRAKERIAAAEDKPVTLEHLALGLECSIGHLCRTFRRVTGTTLYRFQQHLRLTRALEQLERSSDDLVTLALDLGFSSHSHFTSIFRQRFGLTPSEFRRGFAALTPRSRAKRAFESTLKKLCRSRRIPQQSVK